MFNDLERALLAAAERRADPHASQSESGPVFDVPQDAKISVQDSDGHMLTDAVISWSRPAGRDE